MGNLSSSSSLSSSLPPLVTVPRCETARFMGTWFVVGNKPTFLETTCSNSVEQYTLREEDDDCKTHDIDIDYRQNKGAPLTSKLASYPQKGWVVVPSDSSNDRNISSNWKVSPFWPIKMPFPIIELDADDYQYCVVGYPNRSYAWIMARKPQMAQETYDMLVGRLETKHGYDIKGLRKVPQVWTKEERQKRKLDDVIPDDMLTEE